MKSNCVITTSIYQWHLTWTDKKEIDWYEGVPNGSQWIRLGELLIWTKNGGNFWVDNASLFFCTFYFFSGVFLCHDPEVEVNLHSDYTFAITTICIMLSLLIGLR